MGTKLQPHKPHSSSTGRAGFSRILKKIRERFARRQPLNITAVNRECPELIEPFYKPENFIGWRKALDMAGVAYSEIQVDLAPTVECLLCGKESAAISLHLRQIHHYTKQDYLEEFPGAELMSEETRAKIFGVFSRHQTVRGTRALVPHWEPVWSPEYALDRLMYLHQRGHSIHWQHLYTAEKALGAYLLRAFGSYDRAVEAVGLDPKKIRHQPPVKTWTPENVLKAFRKRIKAGKSLTYSVVEKDCSGLVGAAAKYFGTYRAAIEALGIDYETEVKLYRWRNTPALSEEIIAGARRLAAMPEYDWRATERFRKKYRSAIQPLFRSWHGLAEAAGIPVETVVHKRFCVLDRSDVLKRLRQRNRAGKSLQGAAIAREDSKLTAGIRKHFGRLSDALRDAGIASVRVAGRT